MKAASLSFAPIERKIEISRLVRDTGAFMRNINADFLIPAAANMGVDFDMLCDWLEYMGDVGWTDANGRKINALTFRRSLRMWRERASEIDARREAYEDRRGEARPRKMEVLRERGIEAQKRAAEKKRREESAKPGSWALCEERCGLYCESKNENGERRFCKAGYLVPPQLQERPVPPEQCPRFCAGEEA